MPHAQVNAVASRLSLRSPQRRALEILDRVTELVPLGKPGQQTDLAAALAAVRAEYPSVTDFEREFPSLCFALATGVGKTRLMGAFVSYLHTAHGVNNFFVLAPNLTIYNKLISDFTPGTPKYVFTGIAAFATQPPEIITGDTWQSSAGSLFDPLVRCKINIFNISKINTEVRGGKSPRIKRLSEYLGESYFDYLAALPDLVLLMDESHRYRASAGVRAINELHPILGLELTATPFVTTGQRTEPFRNVILDYPLRRAMEDGFVKEPAVVTRQNFNPDGMEPAALERMKLEDGVRLHEQTKVQLETYAREQGLPVVKPFVLVIARDTTHAASLLELIKSDEFFAGRYRDKVIQVDSSGSGAEKDETIERLLKVEQRDEPTEIVIHVNMLKEGWDVTNLYTIVPLRAASARVLIEQTIGRGLRLPYGKRTGVPAVDRLSIVAHDRFQEIVDAANQPDSIIKLHALVIGEADLVQKPRTVVATPLIESKLGITPEHLSDATVNAGSHVAQAFTDSGEQEIARITYTAIRSLQRDPVFAPSIASVAKPEAQKRLVAEVQAQFNAGQLALDGVGPEIDVTAVVASTTALVIGQTISIPRIVVVPRGEVRSGFRDFPLDLATLRYQPVSEVLWIQHLGAGVGEAVGVGSGGIFESRLADYVVSGLIDFDDVSYDDNAAVLYSLAEQVAGHFLSYLSDEDAHRVLRVYQRDIANFVHTQMQAHYWEDAVEYDVRVNSGFSDIVGSAFSQTAPTLNFRISPAGKANMGALLFDGFQRCLLPVQKFDSDTERTLAVILDRDAEKWFRPAVRQFQIEYRDGHQYRSYQPDFVAELADRIVMIETKAHNQMDDRIVQAKRTAAVEWCKHASSHAAADGSKPWQYALIPHDEIRENWDIGRLLAHWTT